MPSLRVFDVPLAAPGAAPGPAVERAELLSIDAEGDAAKPAARKLLTGIGLVVRSLNWGPNQRGETGLIAYVSKKEGT